MTSVSNASEKNSEGPDLFAYKLANQKAMSCFLIAFIFYRPIQWPGTLG
ncbi:hypothetical protein HMPREF3213_02865 [Heyndrickxia coagulans]|uniref:Uncharacterized protein n=1 Tax=Heyndrickxia coagulans TaxID=1398 RepID=A0A133KGW5_HEYCO|nr:hypothetical protein HMPREF3213_02865 [Heyndrickxia coagulans]